MTPHDDLDVRRAAALLRRGGVLQLHADTARDLGADDVVTGASEDGTVLAAVYVFDDWEVARDAEARLLESEPGLRISTNGSLLLAVRAVGDSVAEDAVSAVLEGFAGDE